ncbi:UNVERIFIED_CONTAM: hypothetical protein FKN15_038729 [Acipenser sinensis]
MASGGGSLAALWTEINRCGQNGDFTRALKSVNKILQECRDDVTALNCKVVCLIQNGNFKEALNVIHTHNKVFGSDVIAFEKAYCEYRLNRVENALKTIESTSQQTDKLKELYGQVLYRLERYEECLAVYRDLIRNSQDDYEEERKTNLSAVVAALSAWEQASPEDLGLPETSYELCYNSACTLIGQGRLPEAMKKLQEAEELCRQSLSEDSDITEEDIDAELAVIHSQMAYVMQLQGRTEDALQLYNQVIKLNRNLELWLRITPHVFVLNLILKVKSANKQILVLGLDGAGKTSILHCLATGTVKRKVSPTEGFNAVCINTEDVQMEFLEIGGSETLRTYWHMYLKKAQVLVFVVDSANPSRFSTAKNHLHQLIKEDAQLPLVVLLNKQASVHYNLDNIIVPIKRKENLD